jgi:hypothetical protein
VRGRRKTQNEDSKQMGRRRIRNTPPTNKDKKERENPNQKTKHTHKSAGASYTLKALGFSSARKGY